MKISINNLFIFLFIVLISPLTRANNYKHKTPQVSVDVHHDYQNLIANITLHISLESEQFVYADSIALSIDTPNITLNALQFNQQAQNDSEANDLSVFSNEFTISTQAICNDQSPDKANLHFSFLLNNNKQVFEKIYSVTFFDICFVCWFFCVFFLFFAFFFFFKQKTAYEM